MKYFSMFSGIGGFEYGIDCGLRQIQQSNNETQEVCDHGQTELQNSDVLAHCIGYSEIDKYAIQIYSKHYGGHKNYGNATTINTANLPDFDLLVGGSPCQAFSIAGKRQGFNDTRGTLSYEIARICADKIPRCILLENVKGLLSHDNGKTFQTILGVFSDIGYDIQWQVLNSKNFGVPQNRERVFIVGYLGGEGRRQVFPIGESDRGNVKACRGGQLSANIQASYKKGVNNQNQLINVVGTLESEGWEKRQNGRRFKEDGEPSFTLTGQDIHGVFNGTRIRRLTPTECERLQGFPDGWTEGISDSQRYKCLGNAVTTNVITEIIKRMFTELIGEMR